MFHDGKLMNPGGLLTAEDKETFLAALSDKLDGNNIAIDWSGGVTGCPDDGENAGWMKYRLNGTETITIRINGGAQDH